MAVSVSGTLCRLEACKENAPKLNLCWFDTVFWELDWAARSSRVTWFIVVTTGNANRVERKRPWHETRPLHVAFASFYLVRRGYECNSAIPSRWGFLK
jgi:hypothetical protein